MSSSTVSSGSERHFVFEKEHDEQEADQRIARKMEREDDIDEIDDTTKQVQCVTLHRRGRWRRKGDEPSWGENASWRQEPRTKAVTLEKQLQARWKFEELIEDQLNRFLSHYKCTIVPTKLKDISKLLMPEQVPPHELAMLNWLGDWRPSAILELVRVRVCRFSSSLSSQMLASNDTERILSEIIHDMQIEEAIIDAEMAEIQSTCVFYLPFAPANSRRSSTNSLNLIEAEFKKVKRVITKAQTLRSKALELVVKKVLSQTEAAEFLVAFAGIEDVIRQSALRLKLKDPVSMPLLPVDRVEILARKGNTI